ncbi:MAG: hypothetical protein ACYCY6_01295 [Minisyncoccota bacterium]
MDIWNILWVISLVLLAIFWRKGAVWGGLTLGLIFGVVISLLNGNWGIVKEAGIIGILIGFAAELLGKLSDRLKKN